MSCWASPVIATLIMRCLAFIFCEKYCVEQIIKLWCWHSCWNGIYISYGRKLNHSVFQNGRLTSHHWSAILGVNCLAGACCLQHMPLHKSMPVVFDNHMCLCWQTVVWNGNLEKFVTIVKVGVWPFVSNFRNIRGKPL